MGKRKAPTKNKERTIDVYDIDREQRLEIALADFDKKVEVAVEKLREGGRYVAEQIDQLHKVEMMIHSPEIRNMNFNEYIASLKNDREDFEDEDLARHIDQAIEEKLKNLEVKPKSTKRKLNTAQKPPKAPAVPSTSTRSRRNADAQLFCMPSAQTEVKAVIPLKFLPSATPLHAYRGLLANETVVYSVKGSPIMLNKKVGDRLAQREKLRGSAKK